MASIAVAWLIWSSVFIQSRSDVTGTPAISGNELPDVTYASLYEAGSFEAKCYEALEADFAAGVCPPSWDVMSWSLLPGDDQTGSAGGRDDADKSGDEENDRVLSETLSSVSKFVLLDNPQYASYLNGNMAFDTVGNRYRPRACSNLTPAGIKEDYESQQSLIDTNYITLNFMAEGSDAKYACVAYRFLSETMKYDKTSESSSVKEALSTHRTGGLGLALTMKALLDAGRIPNYIAYGTLVDTGLPYTWNVAWLDDSWKVFDVPVGCETRLDDNEQWVVDNNVASIPRILRGSMMSPKTYAEKATKSEECVALQLRYESMVASSKASENTESEEVTHSVPLTYRSLLDESKQRFYDAVVEDLVSWRYIDDANPESWFVSPIVIKDDEECQEMTEVASCAMYDSPVLSVTNGGGGWSLKYWVKTSEFGYISRYFISSPISNADGNIGSKMETTRNSAHAVYESAESESEGDMKKFVYAAYRDISSNCLYSDDRDDTLHHNDAYGALVEGESKCYGVSCAMKMVLDEKGIPNFVAYGIMHGEDGDMGHAWNMVYVDGEWYACDLTAGSLLAAEDYADNTLNREILYSDINEMDTFYKKCMVPSDDFYAPGNIVPSELSVELQESYGNRGNSGDVSEED